MVIHQIGYNIHSTLTSRYIENTELLPGVAKSVTATRYTHVENARMTEKSKRKKERATFTGKTE